MDELVRAAVFGERAGARSRALADLGDRPGRRRAARVDPRSLPGARTRRDPAASPCRRSTCAACRTTPRARSSARRSSSNAGAFILEIARSEIAYTDQRPAEYVAVMLAAALREGFRGPVFIQGDHFQVNAKKFAVDPSGEVDAVKQLAREAIAAGFYNIDVDTSTLVDLSKPIARRAAAAELRAGGRAHARTFASSSPRGHDLGRRRDRRSGHREQHRRGAARVHGRLQSHPARSPGTMAGSVQDQRADRERRTAASCFADGSIADVKLDLDTLRDAVAGRARGVRARRRGAARRVDAARRRVQQLPEARDAARSTSRRTSRTCCSITSRRTCADEIYEWLRREREGRAEGQGYRRAVLLQDPQEGARSVQAPALGSAGRREAALAQAYDAEVRVPVRAAGGRRHRATMVREMR